MNKKAQTDWGFVMTMVAVVLLFSAFIGLVIFTAESEKKEDIRKCKILCNKKSLQFFDTLYIKRSFDGQDACQCIDKEGELSIHER